MTEHAIIFVNGDIQDGRMVRRAFTESHNPLIIAADGGARQAKHYDFRVDLLIGDMDSLTADEIDDLKAQGTEIQRFPQEKDETDLELALFAAVERDMTCIHIVGGAGGRLDQTLSNIYLLALSDLKNSDVRMVNGDEETCLLRPGKHHINGASGDTVSLLPIGGAAHGIHTENLYYPLFGETLNFGPARGISNVMETDSATVSIERGLLLLIHTMGRA